jgi:adenylate kinase
VGPPGAGKGTQAQFIAAHYDVPKVSTGDLFRANVGSATPLGLEAKRYMDAGELVPDSVTIAMVRDRLSQDDAVKGFLLDGFPRNTAQAEVLADLLDGLGAQLDVVVELVVDNEEIIRRLSGRRTCRQCGHAWHVDFDPPRTAGACDRCGGELFQRDDDKPETVRRRLEVYAEQTAPVVGWYEQRGLLVRVNAMGTVDEVTARVLTGLRPYGG